jgi:methionyl-tRNA synthetase
MGPNEQMMQFLLANPLVLIIFIAWTFIWKGIALWMSAKRDQKNWFIALLILNTLGILEIGYILYTKNKEKKEEEESEEKNLNL